MNQPLVARSSRYLVSEPAAKLRAKLLGNSIEARAHARVVIADGHAFEHPPAVFDPQELRLITGTASTSNVEQQLEIARGKLSQHRPSVAYTLKNVFHADGVFYGNGFRHNISVKNKRFIDVGRAPWIPGGVLGQCWLGDKFFGHSLHEEVPLAMLGKSLGTLIGVQRDLTAQQKAYFEFFETGCEHIPARVWIEELTVLADDSYSLSKAERWRSMRARFQAAGRRGRHPGTFLARGATGQKRTLVNEQAVADYLRSVGFQVINPGEASLPEIIDAVAGARVVVGVEGSQLAHGFFGVQDGGAMVVIQPPMRFDNAYKERCDMLGITYSFTVAQPEGDGFILPLDQLKRALDRVA